MKPRNKKIFKITLTAVACLAVIYLGVSAYGAKEAMTIPRIPLLYPGSVLGVPYEDVSFASRGDNVTLKGWFLPGANSQVIVFVHGGFQNRLDENVDTKTLAPALAKRGYNVLLYDLRGRGESSGKGQTLSYIDEDIGGAVDYLESRGFSAKNISLIGYCAGGAEISIYAASNEVGALVLDGCFIDAGTMVMRQGQSINIPGWLTRLFIPGGTFFTHLIYDYHRIDPVDVIPEIKCPILFIHESLDEFTTQPETRRMLAVSVNPANDILEIPNANHSKAFQVQPQQYLDKIDGFLTKLRK